MSQGSDLSLTGKRGTGTHGQGDRRQSVLADQEPARAGRGHDDPHGQDDHVGAPAALSVWRRVRDPVPVRAAAVLVPAARLDRGVRLRSARPPGGQLPCAVRVPGSPRRLLRAGERARVRAVRDRGDHGRRRRHGDHRRPGRAQDPRGARRAAGARRRPGQEPRGPALPGADDRDRPLQHLRAAVRHLRRRTRDADLQRSARPVLRDAVDERVDSRPVGVGGEDHPARRGHRDRLLVQGDDRLGRRGGGRPIREPGRRHLLPRSVRVQLRVHADAVGHASGNQRDQVIGWLAVPRDWVASFGDITKFLARVFGEVLRGRVFRFFGEALRQAGILIVGSTIVILSLCFIIGLQCGIEGAYLQRSVGAPAYAGVFSAWCDLRELVPYAFGYMMAAKVGTGLVAEIGAMRITDEIDALEVMGISSMTFLCATRLLAAIMVLPFMYLAGVGAGFFASYLAVVQQIGEVSSGGYFLIFWMFQNSPDLLYSLVKGMAMALMIVLVGCYYGYTAGGGPVGVGTATAKSMVFNTVGVHLIGMLGTQVFWGFNPNAPIGG